MTPAQMDKCIVAFEDYTNNRPDWWDQFNKESWRVVSEGAPRAGEYADIQLQQLWEAFLAGAQSTSEGGK
jgi:hypothetical protein